MVDISGYQRWKTPPLLCGFHGVEIRAAGEDAATGDLVPTWRINRELSRRDLVQISTAAPSCYGSRTAPTGRRQRESKLSAGDINEIGLGNL